VALAERLTRGIVSSTAARGSEKSLALGGRGKQGVKEKRKLFQPKAEAEDLTERVGIQQKRPMEGKKKKPGT